MKSGFDVIDLILSVLKSAQAKGEAPDDDERLDVVIAGSGPAGLGAATRAKHLGLKYAVCEKSTAAATIRDYPRAKIIQAAPGWRGGWVAAMRCIFSRTALKDMEE